MDKCFGAPLVCRLVCTSHGCIRLTNWDARELAKSVKKGTPVVVKGNTAGYQKSSGPR